MPPLNIRYQLLHRTASAIIEAKQLNARYAMMIVHSFSTEHKWFSDYQDFLDLFGNKHLAIEIAPTSTKPAFAG
ncbi:MAG: hypothetical protein Fur0022_48270 [Anaerolineales bacterium]